MKTKCFIFNERNRQCDQSGFFLVFTGSGSLLLVDYFANPASAGLIRRLYRLANSCCFGQFVMIALSKDVVAKERD